ncbi:hypothetical protein [Streptomyces sp. NPDC088910]|uniref:hypothetical protein n=1 Tax=Streptomyces sp. NPDC088910 TaxID=3365911 RepID=UPI003805AD4B
MGSPSVAADPAANIADVDAFTSPDKPDTATLVLNSYPFQAPGPADAATAPSESSGGAPSRQRAFTPTAAVLRALRRTTGSASSGG